MNTERFLSIKLGPLVLPKRLLAGDLSEDASATSTAGMYLDT